MDHNFVTVFAALVIFVILNLHMTYKLTNKITTELGFQSSINGCPNIWGLLIHSILFMLSMMLIVYY